MLATDTTRHAAKSVLGQHIRILKSVVIWMCPQLPCTQYVYAFTIHNWWLREGESLLSSSSSLLNLLDQHTRKTKMFLNKAYNPSLLNILHNHTHKTRMFLDKAYNAIRGIRRHTKAENENQEFSLFRCINTVLPVKRQDRSE